MHGVKIRRKNKKENLPSDYFLRVVRIILLSWIKIDIVVFNKI